MTLVAEDLTHGHQWLETISFTVCGVCAVVCGGFPSQCFILTLEKMLP